DQPCSEVTVWLAKNSGVTRFLVASHVTALAPFSQNWKVELCSLSGQAQPGQSKPSGLLVRNRVSGASTTPICSFTAFAVARRAPQPPAGWSYGRMPGTLRLFAIEVSIVVDLG